MMDSIGRTVMSNCLPVSADFARKHRDAPHRAAQEMLSSFVAVRKVYSHTSAGKAIMAPIGTAQLIALKCADNGTTLLTLLVANPCSSFQSRISTLLLC